MQTIFGVAFHQVVERIALQHGGVQGHALMHGIRRQEARNFAHLQAADADILALEQGGGRRFRPFLAQEQLDWSLA